MYMPGKHTRPNQTALLLSAEYRGGRSSREDEVSPFHSEGQQSHLRGSDICAKPKTVRGNWPGGQQVEKARPGGQKGCKAGGPPQARMAGPSPALSSASCMQGEAAGAECVTPHTVLLNLPQGTHRERLADGLAFEAKAL